MTTEISYKCADCGKDFVSHRVRKGVLLCKTCVEARRKKGQGPVQLTKVGGTTSVPAPAKATKAEKAEVKAGAAVEAKKEEPKVAAAPVTPGTSLADLAKSLREKHQKKEKPTEG